MRRVPRISLVLIGLLAAYAVWPVCTFLRLRDAMIAGDSAALAARVDWGAVRSSLKASMSAEAMARLEADPDAPAPTTWQRIKRTAAPRFAGGVIDRYVTPERLPVLLGYYRFWRGTLRPMLREEPPTALAGTLLAGSGVDRFASFWRRLRRAAFVSPTTMVVEVQDKYTSGRRYTATLDLRGWEWKLTGLAISGL
ncbi:MAG TPA: DUF2939 domain-containing protein [Hyphomicrobiaceae bacterium]